MTEQSLRIAIRCDEAWACLTAKQRRAMELYVEEPNVSRAARLMGTSRQAVMKHLDLARKKLAAFAEVVATSNQNE